MLPDYKKLEDNLEQLIFNKYNIKFTKELKDKMKYIDSTFVLDEAYWLFNKAYKYFRKELPGRDLLGITVNIEYPEDIKTEFLSRCALFNIYD